jgi:hypothetical protein
MMPVLIQGPKQPGNDIDVYLRPLVDELLQLWTKPGVRAWDKHKQEPFDLRALLFVTINDWPALSNLSGQTNKGYNACTHCLDKTDAIYLEKCKKIMYCNNPKFWKIEINGFIKILNFGDNKNLYFKYKINFLSFKTCEFEHLLPCFK